MKLDELPELIRAKARKRDPDNLFPDTQEFQMAELLDRHIDYHKRLEKAFGEIMGNCRPTEEYLLFYEGDKEFNASNGVNR